MIKQLLLIVGAIVLCVLIYMAPRTEHLDTADQKLQVEDPPALASGIGDALAILSENDKVKVEGFTGLLSSGNANEKMQMLDSLIKFWDDENVEIAASYASQKAEIKSDEKSNIAAAIRYFDAYKAARDSAKQSILAAAAIRYYEKALEINPSNLNVRTDLGVCYAEATPAPMRGITMLLDVVKEDPEHENAHLNLGFLSVKSGQYEKALERFDNVVKINPLRSEVYLFKAQTQLRMGNKSEALISFEQFIEKSNDQEMVSEVKKYIKQIKNS